MTDDLLDEATRLAGDYADYHHDYGMARVLNELIQRVQQAEAKRDEWQDETAAINEHSALLVDQRDAAREDCNKNATNVRRLTLELHEARGKLDKVRTAVTTVAGEPHDDEISRDVLAILDGKTGD